MENFLPAQQVCAVSLVQPHMMLAGSCLYLLPLRCKFFLASLMWQLQNHCLHCGYGFSSNAFSRSLGCLFISRYKSNCRELGICSLKNLRLKLVFSALYVFQTCGHTETQDQSFTRQIRGGWACWSFVLSNVCSCKVLSHSITYIVMAMFVFCFFENATC